MPGDRLVNGAGVSLRRRGRSTTSDSVEGTDDRKRNLLPATLRWAELNSHDDCRLEYTNEPSGLGGAMQQRVRFPWPSGQNFVVV